MSNDTLRKERTLPARAASSDDVEATTESNTVVGLGPVDLEAVRDDEVVTPIELKAIRDEEDPIGPVDPAEPVEEDEPAPEEVRTGTPGRESRLAGFFKTSLKALAWAVAFPFLCILPFIVVLRIAVVSYQESAYDGWESLGIGMIAAVLLVCVYIAAFMWTFGIRRRFFMPCLNVCLTAMLCYCGYALFHLATSNAKTEEIRSYYTSLHPFLRVAVKNLTFLDGDLVLTDVQRTKEDYQRMGLSPYEYSLHFKQPTGFVHAVDLRTIGRSKVKNLFIELYFILMGFDTIRHVGTADHLHVSLPLSEEDLLAASTDSGKKP